MRRELGRALRARAPLPFPPMSTSAHRGPAPWTIAGWNRRAAHALWDVRIGRAAAEELAVVRLPAYRALAAFVLLLVVAGTALAVLPVRWPVLQIVAALLLLAVAIVAIGVRPMRRASRALRDAVDRMGQDVRGAAPLNDGRAFDAWVRRNDLNDRLRRTDVAALLRSIR